MDSDNQQRYQANSPENGDRSGNGAHSTNGKDTHGNAGESKPLQILPGKEIKGSNAAEILEYIRLGHLMMVNSRRRNGLIICKKFYAEFAGPGAAVGSLIDEDCETVIPVGNLSLITPESHEERQKAYLIRRQWIRLTQQFTDKSVPLQRAQMILNQFETYFDAQTIARIPDEAFALLVGVMPQTVRQVRRPANRQMKVKSPVRG